MLMNRQIR